MNSQMQYVQRMNRRAFTSASAAGAGLIALDPLATACVDLEAETQKLRYPEKIDLSSLDLSPAKWIWYPAVRTLANTVVLFRREFSLPAKPKSVRGWMLGESRYRLEVNGQRMQWGPPPNDPRWPECDPVDLTHVVHEGPNVLGVAVLYYGDGEGTWPMGLPGLIVCLEICHADGETEWLVTDERWLCQVCRAWEPGGHRRSYLRAFQEVFDARKYPSGWSSPNRLEANDWLEATVIECPSDKPVICGKRREPIAGIGTPKETHATMSLRRRSLAMMNETWVPVTRLAEQHVLSWSRPIEEVFAMRTRDAWQAEPAALVASKPDGQWEFALDAERSVALTFEFEEQGVGFPGLTIDAPEGTTFELLVHDAHAVGSEKVLLDTGHHSWTRFVCRQELQELETFDFETARWLQLHFHPGKGNVCIKRVGMRRRIYPWPAEPRVETSEKKLQRLFDAATNTLRNCAQETLVDTMGRERQQYSGDISHQHHALLALTGETRQVARFLVTFSQGMTKDGYFLDCWPAVDRLKRIAQRQLNLTQWGPLLDHGVQFLLDGWNYFLYTGDRTPLEEVLPRYLRFAEYLESIRASDGLLPVEGLGVPWVWVDFEPCFRKQRHKRCAFNLLVAQALGESLANVCRLFDREKRATRLEQFGKSLLQATREQHWSPTHRCYVDNLPWIDEEGAPRFSDIAIARSVLFDQCPDNDDARSLEMLASPPATMGMAYPPNRCWRMWALARGGNTAPILDEFRTLWAELPSVKLNNTISETFAAQPDNRSQWSHAAVVPLYIAAMSLAGIRPRQPGYARYEIRPQLSDLADLELDVTTPNGAIAFHAFGAKGNRRLKLKLPSRGDGVLVVDPKEKLPLETTGKSGSYQLPTGRELDLRLRHT